MKTSQPGPLSIERTPSQVTFEGNDSKLSPYSSIRSLKVQIRPSCRSSQAGVPASGP